MKLNKRDLLLVIAAVFTALLSLPHLVQAHCQIPCGIYDDHSRIQAMMEDAATVEKSIRLITELAGKTDPQSVNQAVRWVMNKEKHAQNIIAIVSDYFLTQRINPDQPDYSNRLARHHAVILAAMKAKQNAEPSVADALKNAIEAIAPYYPGH